ncbi:ankyrin repeat domain-containing protein SOWAHC-like isoform X2 [Sceloporus undulatus]|uniref:ankyrin repeat domain-containing protein SOWAHC-like isoform X2 n=1 Tax=Sceloporus undulatus TaxID=8520 RepID=UPI001C4AF411|nr:ankyrin repeat domain-containing protein SOWAHC-like isoform X2 [Sceloporus undulatus]
MASGCLANGGGALETPVLDTALTTAPQILVTACNGRTAPESDRDAPDNGGGSLGPSPVALEPLEKEWLQGAASGHVATLRQLLQQDPNLATKKDFTSFTALHWAAKHGQEDLVTLLLDTGADVNLRALMELFIWTYGAKQNIRDYSGRLARHYLHLESPKDAPHTPQLGPMRGERSKNRKLASLFLPKTSGQGQRRWGSASDLTEEKQEEDSREEGQEPQRGPQHLALPPNYRPVRKFSR